MIIEQILNVLPLRNTVISFIRATAACAVLDHMLIAMEQKPEH
jgi:hypothetical protein